MSCCHAGANHSAAVDRGCWGYLCEPCWSWCVALMRRLTKIDSSNPDEQVIMRT